MALPWWLRGGLTGGAALLKARLKRIKEGSEVVGKARKVLLDKLAKQLKALKDKKQKDKEPEKPKKKYTIPQKELKKLGDEEVERYRQMGERARFTTLRTITGTKKGDLDISDFSDALLKQDIKVAKHVKGLQKLKQLRDIIARQSKPRGKMKYQKQVIKEHELDPKLAKPAKESFQRIQKKKDRFKKKDDKKKGKQGD